MLTDKQLQSLRNLGNEAEVAAAEIERLRWDLGELRGRIAQMERDEGKALAAERERCITAAEDAYIAGKGAKGCIDAMRALCGPNVAGNRLAEGKSG